MPKKYNSIFFVLMVIAFIIINFIVANGQDIIYKYHSDSLIIEHGDDSIQIFKVGLPPTDSIGNFKETKFEIKKNKLIPSFLEFKHGGTETNVFLLENNKKYDLLKVWNDSAYIKRIDFGINLNTGNLMEISDLKSGKYLILYSSCSIGGLYIMELTE